MTLPLIVLLPLVAGAGGALLFDRRGATAVAVTAAAVTAAALALLLTLAPAVFAGRTIIERWHWLPGLGLDLSFRLDGLGFLFAVLILGIGLLIILYARYYLAPTDRFGRFFALLMVFMTAMLGIVLAENVLMLVLFWELTSLSSFLLIAFHNDSSESRQGARIALAVTGGGGLALFAGFLLLGHMAGSYELTSIFAARDAVQRHALYPLALVLVLLGAFTKSAQFPFHFWLPAAMAAPTPVSAYLHSATMVKAGVFLLARLYPVLGGTLLFGYLVSTVGLVTMVFAAYVAVFRHDLKGLLAYSTISHLGLIVFLIGLDTPLSSVAAVFHVVNHATFKASLFMSAGIIDHETGSRDMRRLNGLARYMPHTAALAMVSAAAMAGVPLFNGFLSKEMFFAEALEIRHLTVLADIAPLAVVLGGIFSVAYSARFIHDVFFNGEPQGLPRTPHEPPRYMKVPMEVLVLVVVAIGILPGYTVAPLIAIASRDVFGAPLPPYDIALWHGFNLPLGMSAIAIVGGIAMYWALQRHYNLHLHVPARLTLRVIFQHAMDRAVTGAGRFVAFLQNGSLQRYLAIIVGVLLALGAWPFLEGGLTTGSAALTPVNAVAVVVWVAAVGGALAVAYWHRNRIVAVTLAGVVGLATAITFAYFSAPDLALTQLAVEVVTTVVLLMAVALLPDAPPGARRRGRRPRKALHAALALGAGAGIALLAYAVLTRHHASIAWYFLQQSVPQGGGSNVVNVILVDFRGFDTFGEITVLGIAAIGAWILMESLRVERPPDTRHSAADALIFVTAARVLLPFALLVAMHIFLRGHNQPGGGFVAGLVVAAALVMQYMGEGLQPTLARMRLDFGMLVGVGVALAGLTGVVSMLVGAPFLTSAHGHVTLPLLGEIPLASAMAFDLGVFLTVVGSTLLTLTVLGQTSAAPRRDAGA
ncbi:MAG: monovalent cation/H+ antiporter subunit A [Casimicrobiaceae bacterium]